MTKLPRLTFALLVLAGQLGYLGCSQQEPLADDATGAPPAAQSDEAPQEENESVPFAIVSTNPDGSRVVEYTVTRQVLETRTRTVTVEENGTPITKEAQYTVAVPVMETRQAIVPAGDDIGEYLKQVEQANAPAAGESPEAAPEPPAPPSPEN